jgi:hypothetical protein
MDRRLIMRDLRRDPCRAEARHEAYCGVAAALVATAAASVGSAVIGAHAAHNAADAQVGAANAATGVQRDMFNQIRGDLSPYNAFGQGALTGLNRFLSGNPADVQRQLESTPGYQFDLSQGLKAVQNSAAARGLGASGAALKGASRFATGLADTTFGNQFARYLDSARLGESAAAQSGSFGTAAGQSIGNNLIGAGNAAAGGTVGAANAAAGGLSGIGNSLLLYQLLGNGGLGGGAGGGMYGGGSPIHGAGG